MKLAVIDARANPTESNRRTGSDPLPDGAYEQFIIDVEPWLKAITFVEAPQEGLPPAKLLIIDCAKLPDQNRIVPAWVCVVHENGDVTPAPGIYQLPDKSVAGPVVKHLQLWCKAGLILAHSKFGSALKKEDANARIQYWLAGGKVAKKGWVTNPRKEEIIMRILQQWPFWDSPKFASQLEKSKFKEWQTKLETIKATGYKTTVTAGNLKTIFCRMMNEVKSTGLQNRKNP